MMKEEVTKRPHRGILLWFVVVVVRKHSQMLLLLPPVNLIYGRSTRIDVPMCQKCRKSAPKQDPEVSQTLPTVLTNHKTGKDSVSLPREASVHRLETRVGSSLNVCRNFLCLAGGAGGHLLNAVITVNTDVTGNWDELSQCDKPRSWFFFFFFGIFFCIEPCGDQRRGTTLRL